MQYMCVKSTHFVLTHYVGSYNSISSHYSPIVSYRSQEFVLTGYVVPGCVEYGTWMLWEKSSPSAAVTVARYSSNTVLERSRSSPYFPKHCLQYGVLTCSSKHYQSGPRPQSYRDPSQQVDSSVTVVSRLAII